MHNQHMSRLLNKHQKPQVKLSRRDRACIKLGLFLVKLIYLFTVIIRPAAAGDFEWVADLMVRALSPFYGGDV